jgi:uncharacterized protein
MIMEQKPVISFFLLTAVLMLFPVAVLSQDIPGKPVPPRLVNDFAEMFSGQEVNSLEAKLLAFNDSTSTQIAIVTVPELNGYAIADFAQRLGEKWGIGQKGLDNGVIIVIKPKTTSSEGEVFIAPGYGLEGVIPDIVCAEIIDYEILPAFRNGNYFAGIDKAVNTLMSLASGEFTAEEYGKKVGKGEGLPPGLIFIMILLLFIFIGRSGRSNHKNISTKGLPFWVLMSMMNSGRNSHSGSWGGFSGGGGGGFGGFGGGSFGGGGAGGRW